MLEQRLAKMEKILLSPEAKKQKMMAEAEDDLDDYYEDNLDSRSSNNSTYQRSNSTISATDASLQPIQTGVTTTFSSTLPHSTNEDYSAISNNNNNSNSSSTTSNMGTLKRPVNKRPSEDNHNSHDVASPTSYSSISTTNFPSSPPHMLASTAHQRSRSRESDLLPPMEVIEHIVDLYFAYLFAAAPIFDEDTLRNDLKEGRCSDFLLLSLLAASAR